MTGTIVKSLSGFYYVSPDDNMNNSHVIQCRARGRFRVDGNAPLVGDRTEFDITEPGHGVLTKIIGRRNCFLRPAVANIDVVVIFCCASNPITDPYLIDRVAAMATVSGCGALICVSKTDLADGQRFREIYARTPHKLVEVSAVTGAGIECLRGELHGRIAVFTGDSGVGKSSVINALMPGAGIKTGDVSAKLGRGRHTTRHVELYSLGDGTYIADTPGFASFDVAMMTGINKATISSAFAEFAAYDGLCRFADCAHISEPGCAVLAAVAAGEIHPARHESYRRMRQLITQGNPF